MTLSLIMLTKNAEDVLEKALISVSNLTDEIIIIDDNSTDNTVAIAKKFGATIYPHHSESFGEQTVYALSQVKTDWILQMGSDEVLTDALKQEIGERIADTKCSGFVIPFQCHYMNRQINYGGENYKMLRLFRRDSVDVVNKMVHEDFVLKTGIMGELKNKILHYSYRSLSQMYQKFTAYAVREAKQKYKNGEGVDFPKLFFYAPHMFFARFVESRGYKDGFFRIPLDMGFAYMELATYWLLLWYRIFRRYSL